MITLFKLKYDAAGSSAAPDFINSEIIQFLNDAQLTIVDLLHSQRNFTLLGNLIVVEDGVTSEVATLPYSNAYWTIKKSTILDSYRAYISSRSSITKESKTGFVNNEYIPLDFVNRFTRTLTNKPRFNKCVIFDDQSGRLVALADSYTTKINYVDITYLKHPTLITSVLPSELDSSLHEKVVEVAVDEAIKSIYRAKVPPQQQKQE